jgi:NAD(P)-dependent dehydrogenase (short-subunit alcohol dehydrogenase family)
LIDMPRPTTGWTADRMPDQAGRTVLITGSNSGIGLESALALAARGARVLLACRDRGRAGSARARVAAAATGAAPEVLELDLADLASVRACGRGLLDAGTPVDVLMLNAGVMAMPRGRTADGFETHLGTNHLGHFALAGTLAPALLAAPAPRLVTTSSLAHRAGRVRWRDPQWTGRVYSATLAYGQSKLANLLFTRELDRRARAAGSALVAVAAHPGGAQTNLAHVHGNPLSRAFYDFMRPRTQPAAQGALPQLYAATEPVPGGSYWGPDGPLEYSGRPAPAATARAARDDRAARRLWELSEQLTGVRWPALA